MKKGGTGSGEDDEELHRVLLVFQAGGKITGVFLQQKVDPLPLCCPREQDCRSDKADSCCGWVFPAWRNHLQLCASQLRSSVTDTHSSSGIKPVRTWDRLCGNWRFAARFGRMFGLQPNLWLPGDNFWLLLDSLGLFRWRNAPGDPQLYKNQSVLRRKHANAIGTNWFLHLLDVFWGGRWGGGCYMDGEQTRRRKKRPLRSCKYFVLICLVCCLQIYAGSSFSFWAKCSTSVIVSS